MSFQSLLDEVGIAILMELQRDARLSYSELARRVGMSTPAVTERVRKLEDAGIIQGYGAKLNLEALGYGVMALLELRADPSRYPQVYEQVRTIQEVRECYFVTGESSFLTRVVAKSVSELQGLIERFSHYGSTRTSVVLSSPIVKEFFDLTKASNTTEKK